MQTQNSDSAPAESSPVVMTMPTLRAHLILATFDRNTLETRDVWFVPATVSGWSERIALPHLPLAAEPVPVVTEALILHALGWAGQ